MEIFMGDKNTFTLYNAREIAADDMGPPEHHML